MKAILIDPWEKSIGIVDVEEGTHWAALQDLYKLVGEDGLDFCRLGQGECILVGDHSALHNPPLPHYRIGAEIFYGRGVVLGYNRDGNERETKLTVEDISRAIDW